MNDTHNLPSADPAASSRAERRPWRRPGLARLRAGDAEIGANPATTEEAFAHGS